jgi:hypothetical protein
MAAKKKKKKSKKSPPKRAKSKPAKKKAAPKKKAASAPKKPVSPQPRHETSPRPIWQKLFIKGGTMLLANAPDEVHLWLAGSPATLANDGDVETVFGFARDHAELENHVAPSLPRAQRVVIIAYQKGSKDLHRDTLWLAMQKHGWEGSTLVSVDDTWSAMRFLRPTAA